MTMNTPSSERVRPAIKAMSVCLFFFALLAHGARAQSPDNGTVTGQVMNQATGNFLPGAIVTVEGTTLSTTTDRMGRFVLPRVPAGQRVLSITYTGLNPSTTSVTVSPGANTVPTITLTSEVYLLESFVVAGVREGTSQAIMAQRNAPNIKTVVSTDAYGNLADGNLGEFLKRVPGVGTDGGVDEVTRVRVRGAAAEHTAVTMDGTRMPSPHVRSDSREFQIDQLPADFIESIEVIKAPTPDMDGDAIGGTVNLVTKSAFDTDRRYLQYTAGGNHRTLGNMTSYFGSLQYADVYGADRNLGMFLTLSYSETDRPQDFAEMQYDGPIEGPNAITSFRLQPDYKNRKRTGAGLRFDYRLSENSSISFGLMYNHYEALDERRRWTADHRANNAGDRAPGFSSNFTEYLLGREQMQGNVIIDDQKVYSLQASGKHNLQGGTLKLDYGVAYAPAKGWQDRWLFQVRGQRNQNRTVSLAPGSYLAETELLSGIDIRDYNNAEQSDMTFEEGDSTEDIWGLHLNARKDLDTRFPSYIKSGLRYRSQERWRSYDRVEALHKSGLRGPFDANRFKGTGDEANKRLFDGRYENLVVFGDPVAAYNDFVANPDQWDFLAVDAVQRSAQEDGTASEKVSAAYVMGDIKFGRLGVLAGVRVEQTDVRGESPAFIPITPPLPSNATVEEQVERRRQEWDNTAVVKSSYRNWFPGLHLRYAFTSGLLARLSYSEGIGRPNFSNLKPLTRVNIEALSIQRNNVALLPQESKNYDLSFEYYFEPVGLFSVTLFRKEIKNFISTVTEFLTPTLLQQYGLESQYEGWDFRTQMNTGDGEIEGFEIAYNQHLGDFAAWLQGFSVMANYTKAKGTGRLEEIIPAIWNAGLVYERSPWTFRFQLNYQDQYLTSRSTNPMQSRFVEEQMNADINVQYRFSPKFAIFVDYTNAFGETIRRTTGEGVHLPQQYIDIGRRVNFGVRGRF